MLEYHTVAVYAPGTRNVDVVLSDGERDTLRDKTLRAMSELFGSATCVPAVGAWTTDAGETVVEPINIVTANVDAIRDEDTEWIKNFAAIIARAYQQVSVTVAIDGGLEFIIPDFVSVDGHAAEVVGYLK